MQSLVQAAPLALGTRDGKYQLYPFMMAAMIGNLDLTLQLLLENPTMVESGIAIEGEELSRKRQSENDVRLARKNAKLVVES